MNNIAGRLEKEIAFYAKLEQKLQDSPIVFYEYYTSMRASRKAYTTIGVYINNIMHFANFITNNNITEDFYKHISSTDIERYMISLETIKTKNGLKRTGDDILQARWSSLNTFFVWLVRKGYIEKNLMDSVDRPKNNTEHKVTFLSKTEIGKLLKAVEQNPNKVIAARDRTLFSLAIATGLRASALTNINLEDIDWDNGVVNVIEKRQKVRQIPLGTNVLNILQEWIDIRNKEFTDANTNAMFISQKKSTLNPS